MAGNLESLRNLLLLWTAKQLVGLANLVGLTTAPNSKPPKGPFISKLLDHFAGLSKARQRDAYNHCSDAGVIQLPEDLDVAWDLANFSRPNGEEELSSSSEEELGTEEPEAEEVTVLERDAATTPQEEDTRERRVSFAKLEGLLVHLFLSFGKGFFRERIRKRHSEFHE
jgi:hypothetical protein